MVEPTDPVPSRSGEISTDVLVSGGSVLGRAMGSRGILAHDGGCCVRGSINNHLCGVSALATRA
jgi:hypothetical protein